MNIQQKTQPFNQIRRKDSKSKSNLRPFNTPLKLKVQATPHGYFYVFRSLVGQIICSHVGLLPDDFAFDKATAELFALCEAARRFHSDEELKGHRISIVCCSLPLAYSKEPLRRAA